MRRFIGTDTGFALSGPSMTSTVDSTTGAASGQARIRKMVIE